MANGTVAKTQTRVANNTRTVAKGGAATKDAYAGKSGRNLVDTMKKDMKAAQGGDGDAMKRLEALAKQNQELFKKFQELMGGNGPQPDPGTNPAPAPGPQPAPNPAPAPGGGGGGGGCPGGNCGGGGGGGASGAGGAGGLMGLLQMLLELLQKKQQEGGDPNADPNAPNGPNAANGPAGAQPIAPAAGGGVPAVGGV
ncbi:MAG: hypothetical protein RIT81_36295 [Deltaproteobacteria bacterium]